MREVPIIIDDTWKRGKYSIYSPAIDAGEFEVTVYIDFEIYTTAKIAEVIIHIERDGDERRRFEVTVGGFDRGVAPSEALAETVDLANEIAPALGLRFTTEAGR